MVAAVIIRDKKLLLARNIKKGVRLEPPGGKVNEGEVLEDAVVREAMEEMGRDVVVKSLVGTYETDTPEGGFDVSLFFCDMEGDPIEGLEPGKIGGFEWLTFNELADLAEKNAAGDLSVTLVPNVIAALPELARYLV